MSIAVLSRRSFLRASATAALAPAVGIRSAIAEDVPQPKAITVSARPIEALKTSDRTQTRFGSLSFRGGLSLRSSFPGFGGLSAIRMNADGKHFVMASDKADWFTGRIVYNGKVPVALDVVVAAPMLDATGATLRGKKWYDTEAIAQDGDTIYVGIERVNRIVKFDFGKNGVRARAEELSLPPFFKGLPYNKGIEGLVVVPKGPFAGTLIVLVERALDGAGNLLAFLLMGPRSGSFTIRRTNGYDISDGALLPDGDLLLLERKFSVSGGAGIRIRRIETARIAPGVQIDGPVLFEADLGFEIDNFEGLDVHQTAEGETVLTLVSDDNFSFLQRTLLMQFTLVE